MRLGTPGFQPERLVQAREARGLTQVALSELIGISSSNISRWERTDQKPEPEALEGLSKALRVPVSYFLRPIPAHGRHPVFFRSMASTTLQLRKRTSARLRWLQDISLYLQEWVDLPAVDVPTFNFADHLSINNEDIENAAMECRNRWGLGLGPIADLLLVLENAGIILCKDETGSVKMDGLSNWSESDERPYMLIAKDKDTCVRSRFDAAHELGHLVLHRHLNPSILKKAQDFKEVEKQAFQFAGAFLMPAESFGAEIWSPSLNTFLSLKERWKTSIVAMIMRCHQIGVISESYKTQLFKYCSSRGWRSKGEPLDDNLILEYPRLLSRSVKLLIAENIRTRDELLTDMCLNDMDVESLCGLPADYLSSKPASILLMPKVKRQWKVPNENHGKIIPLRKH